MKRQIKVVSSIVDGKKPDLCSIPFLFYFYILFLSIQRNVQ